MRRLCRLIAMSLGLVSLLGGMGCSTNGGGASPRDDDTVPPTIADFTLSPPELAEGWRGGSFTVEVRAEDDLRIGKVQARLTGPGASDAAITLTLIPGSDHRYRGVGTAPANTNVTGGANTYFVTAWAQDAAGNSSAVERSLSFTVPAPEAPLPPPTQW